MTKHHTVPGGLVGVRCDRNHITDTPQWKKQVSKFVRLGVIHSIIVKELSVGCSKQSTLDNNPCRELLVRLNDEAVQDPGGASFYKSEWGVTARRLCRTKA